VDESTDEAPVALVRDVTGYRADEAVRKIVREEDRDWQRKLHEAALSRESGSRSLNFDRGEGRP
jgi:F420-0:gamma-glutamyl ligase